MISDSRLAEVGNDSINNITLTGQTANISSVILALTTSGKHRVNAVMACTTASGGAANVTLRISYTGDVAVTNQHILTREMTGTGVSTVTYPLYLTSGSITFDVTGYSAGTYALRVWVEYGGL
jgi:hypothetical protein